ncbi:MAG TPA: conjugal transfer protein TraF, partial [Nitrospiria bacterium]|nr:conjugal transfer protein TraF [Nitrospiria bacterium]
LGEEVNKIQNFAFDALDNGQIPANRVADFIGLLNALKSFDANNDRAATVLADGGALRIQIGHFGIGGLLSGSISAKGKIDLFNISPVSTGATFTIDDFTDPANYGCSSPCVSVPGGLDSAQEAAIRSHLVGDLGWTSTQADNFVNAVDNGLAQSGAPIPSDIVTQINNVATIADAAAGAGGTFDENTSSLLFQGIAIAEIPLTYGYAITNNFSIGGNVKFMTARVYNSRVLVFNNDFGEALKKARDDYETSQNFGIDLGMLYRFGDALRVGLVGRNLNFPKFDMKKRLPTDEDHITEKPQVRAGVAFKPLSWITLAADLDLTRNDTTVGGDYDSQNLGGGVEFNLLKFLQLRGGLYGNLAKSDIGVVYTAGIGLNLWLINLDVGASMAGHSTTVDNQTLPKEARAEFALSMLF